VKPDLASQKRLRPKRSATAGRSGPAIRILVGDKLRRGPANYAPLGHPTDIQPQPVRAQNRLSSHVFDDACRAQVVVEER
jgi:hypothetical protein